MTQTDHDIQEIFDRLSAMENDVEFFRTRLTNFESDMQDISEAVKRIETRHRGR